MARKPAVEKAPKETKAEKSEKTFQEFLTLVEENFNLPLQELSLGPTIGLISKEACLDRLENPVEKKQADMFVDLLYEQQSAILLLKKAIKDLGDILHAQADRISSLELHISGGAAV